MPVSFPGKLCRRSDFVITDLWGHFQGGCRGQGCGRGKSKSRGGGQGCCREGCCRKSSCSGEAATTASSSNTCNTRNCKAYSSSGGGRGGRGRASRETTEWRAGRVGFPRGGAAWGELARGLCASPSSGGQGRQDAGAAALANRVGFAAAAGAQRRAV